MDDSEFLKDRIKEVADEEDYDRYYKLLTEGKIVEIHKSYATFKVRWDNSIFHVFDVTKPEGGNDEL